MTRTRVSKVIPCKRRSLQSLLAPNREHSNTAKKEKTQKINKLKAALTNAERREDNLKQLNIRLHKQVEETEEKLNIVLAEGELHRLKAQDHEAVIDAARITPNFWGKEQKELEERLISQAIARGEVYSKEDREHMVATIISMTRESSGEAAWKVWDEVTERKLAQMVKQVQKRRD